MNNFYKNLKSRIEPYIIAEIGSNHNGDMALAEKLILSAKKCGADCVKFQSFSPTSLISKSEYENNQKYNDSDKKHFGSLKEMVEKYYLRKEQHFFLKSLCDKIGIEFASTPFAQNEVDLLVELEVPFIKIASMDINNLSFLKYIASKMKPVILSTGMASIGEIEKAIASIEEMGNHEIVLLHCISIYPPKYEDINLCNISMLKKAFGYPVGFSDHSIGIAIPIASVVLGSCVIEKHFTIDKNMPGWDHEISADPSELSEIVQQSKNVIRSLGCTKRIVNTAELEKRTKLRRSLVVARDIKKGEILTEIDVISKRPGIGISPSELEYVLERKLKTSKEADSLLKWEDFE